MSEPAPRSLNPVKLSGYCDCVVYTPKLAAVHPAETALFYFVQQTAESTPEPSYRQEDPPAKQDPYARRVTQEGLTIQTLPPPVPDAAQVVAGRVRRARAALVAHTRQMHGPLPMLPRKQLPRPDSPVPVRLEGEQLLVTLSCSTLPLMQPYRCKHPSPLCHCKCLQAVLTPSCVRLDAMPASVPALMKPLCCGVYTAQHDTWHGLTASAGASAVYCSIHAHVQSCCTLQV